MSSNNSFLSGNEALAQGAWEAGVKVACAYPGTPSSEILAYIAKFDEIDSQWSVNEKVAFEVAFGASTAGVRALYVSKHVGVNVAMDPLMTAAYMGVNGGFVIVTADDPGIHSSQNEQDNRYIAQFAQIPLLEPSSPSETREFTKLAFEISENFDIPVMLRITTRISHSKETMNIEDRKNISDRKFSINIPKNVMVPKNALDRHADLIQRNYKLKEYSENAEINKIEMNDKKIGIITDSVSYLHVKESMPNASVLKLGMTFPFPDKKILEFASHVEELFIIEELEPFIETHVRALGLNPKGKDDSFRVGELKPEYIKDIIEGKQKEASPIPAGRKPRLCKGCPHEQSFLVLKKHNAIVTGDIGCYTLGALAPLSSLHTCVCMGGSITFMEGFQKVLDNKIVAVIGDSTFVHTGIPGLINAVYNKAKGVVIILDNSTTAMTGNQPHPATGITIKGEETKQLVLEDICKAIGVDSVDVINPYKSQELDDLIVKRMKEDSLSVIITRAPCVLLKKKNYQKSKQESN